MCKEIAVKLDNKNWHDHVPKSIATSHEGKVYHITEPTSVKG